MQISYTTTIASGITACELTRSSAHGAAVASQPDDWRPTLKATMMCLIPPNRLIVFTDGYI